MEFDELSSSSSSDSHLGATASPWYDTKEPWLNDESLMVDAIEVDDLKEAVTSSLPIPSTGDSVMIFMGLP